MGVHRGTRLSDEMLKIARLPRCYRRLLAEQASWSDYPIELGEIFASEVDRLLALASGLTARRLHLMAETGGGVLEDQERSTLRWPLCSDPLRLALLTSERPQRTSPQISTGAM